MSNGINAFYYFFLRIYSVLNGRIFADLEHSGVNTLEPEDISALELLLCFCQFFISHSRFFELSQFFTYAVDSFRYLVMYDVYVPLIEIPKRVIPYDEALEIVEDALQPLGEEYIAGMKKGFTEGWIDVYENEGKTSGAYSFGSYGSKPFILCNYADTLQDVFTVIHGKER